MMAIHVCSTGQTFKPRRFYLTGDITKLNPFIQVRWNDHLVNYFPLMYRYGINTIILHLTFSRAEFRSFRIKC